MPRNGSGGYTQPVANFAPNTLIDAADVNSWFDDLGNEIANSLAKDGQTTPTANLPMGGFRLTGLGAPVNPADSVRKQDVWVLVQQQVAASAASLDFTLPTATDYILEFSRVLPATAGATLQMRTSTNGGSSYDSGGSDYSVTVEATRPGTSSVASSTSNDSGIPLSFPLNNAGVVSCSGWARLWPGNGSQYPNVLSNSNGIDNGVGTLGVHSGIGVRSSGTQANAIRILMSSGNITTGIFTLFARA